MPHLEEFITPLIKKRIDIYRISYKDQKISYYKLWLFALGLLLVSISIGQNKEYPLVRTPQSVSAQRRLPSNVLPYGAAMPASFSANPTDEEIFRVHFFEEPLVPTKDTAASSGENTALLYALAAYSQRKDPDDFAAILHFLKSYPNSHWKGSLLANLGMVYRRTGYYNQALAAWQQSWSILKDKKDLQLKAMADKVLSDLLLMYGWTGRVNTIDSIFHQISGRTIQEPIATRVSMMRNALWIMRNDPGISFKCGPYALATIFSVRDSVHKLKDEFWNIKSTPKGFSLTQLQDFAKQIGMDYQMAYRSPGAPVIINSVVHWKLDHYSALLAIDNNGIRCKDPTVGTTYGQEFWLTLKALDSSASGYFLVPSGALPPGWRAVGAAEGNLIFGKGNVPRDPGQNVTRNDSTSKNPNTCPFNPNTPKKPMAESDVHLGAVSLHIFDRPVYYTPPVGPAINFDIEYHQRDTYQAPVFNFSNTGHNWTFGWLSYVKDNPRNPRENANIYHMGGGDRTYTDFSTTTNSYAPELQTNDVLVRTCDNCYELRHPDGSKEVYGRPEGNTSTARKIFLTQIVDVAGNAVNIYYDSLLRITAVKDAIGQVTTLSYENTADQYLLTKVTDPFRRFAQLDYDSEGRLMQITDMIGIVSSFKYDATGFIQQMTTPYGTTSFINEDDGTGNYSAVETHYPQGEKERVEFRNNTPGIYPNGFFGAEPVVPKGIPVFNEYMRYRNTFYWDKKAMQYAPGDYKKAKIYHWLHGSSDIGELYQTSPIFESVKEPLENRTWFYYQNERRAGFANQGMSAKPYLAARVLNDGTTQLYTTTYNSLGKVTQSVDPLKRSLSYTYDSTNINLLEVRQTTSGSNELLAKYTYNAQHLPLTATDASGQTTHFNYNDKGQPLTITNPKNETTTFNYDGNGYLQNIVGPVAGATVSFTYDGFGRVRTVTDAEGYTITTDYDALDRPTVITYPDSSFEQIVYDRLDAVKVKDRLGRWTTTTYDSLDRPVKREDALGRITQYVWCNCGSLAQIIDPLNHITSFERDIEGRLISKTYNDGKSITYSYDTTGRLKQVTDAKGQTTNYSYFIDDNVDSISYQNTAIATPSVAFTYDPHYNRVASMADGTGPTLYNYNPVTPQPMPGAGRLASVDGPLDNDLIEYQYDSLGRTNGRAINGVQSSVNFDVLGRVISSTNVLGTFSYAYVRQTSRVSSIQYPNGQNTVFDYFDNYGDQRLKEIWNKAGNGSTVSKFDYEYNAVGQITKWTQQSGSNIPKYYELGYDLADQLVSAIQKADKPAAIINQYLYKYDVAGNRLSEQINNSLTVADYNDVNQLVRRWDADSLRSDTTTINNASIDSTIVSGNGAHHGYPSIPGVTPVTQIPPFTHYIDTVHVNDTLTYDDNGNTVTTYTPHRTFEWDAADRLVKIIQDSSVIEFIYDGLSRRVAEKVNGVVIKRWLWDGTEMAEERDATGGMITKRFFKQGEQIDDKNYYFTSDHLGSVREMTDSNSTVQARYDYDPYGRRTRTFGNLDADFGFTSHYYHVTRESDLALYRAYDASLGRWLSRDPLQNVGIREGINIYEFVNNNPVNHVDVRGESWEGKACRAACWGVGGALCAAVACGCAAGDFFTFGGMTIPCTAAIIASCTAANAGSSICGDACPQ